MRVSLKAAFAAIAMMLGLAAFASPSEARTTFYGGDGGIVMVRDHGRDFRHHRGFQRHGVYGRRHYRGGPRYYRHGSFRRDRGYYGRRHYYGGSRYDRRHHYRGNGLVIRLR